MQLKGTRERTFESTQKMTKRLNWNAHIACTRQITGKNYRTQLPLVLDNAASFRVDFLDHQTSHITSKDEDHRFNLEDQHDRQDDGDGDDDDDQKLIIACPYKCDKCQFESLKKSTLEEHQNATHGTTQKCQHCSYISRKKNALSKHIRTMHQEIHCDSSSEEAAGLFA